MRAPTGWRIADVTQRAGEAVYLQATAWLWHGAQNHHGMRHRLSGFLPQLSQYCPGVSGMGGVRAKRSKGTGRAATLRTCGHLQPLSGCVPFDQHGNGFTATLAERCDAQPTLAMFERVHQGDQDSRSTASDGMP